MKSLNFPKVNVVFAKDNPVHETFAYRDNSPNGNKDIVACYVLTFWERVMVLLTGKIWVNITTMDGNLRPMRMSVLKKEMLTTRKERRDKEKKISKMKKKLGVPRMDNLPTPPKKKFTVPPPGENGLKAVK